MLIGLEEFSSEGHEILIINDGSNDGSEKILSNCNFIKLLHTKKNMGKGFSLKKGILQSKNKNIIIFDGDLELNIKSIYDLMKLNPNTGNSFILGNRFGEGYSYTTIWDLGNLLMTKFFNYLFKTNVNDILCCAKSFNKNDIDIKNISSMKFDIDLEISFMLLTKNSNNFSQVEIDYSRRKTNSGKKLRLRDAIIIFKRIFLLKLYKI